MGPQFSFRTFQHMGQRYLEANDMYFSFPKRNLEIEKYSFSEDDLADMDVTVTTRPQQSEPMQMPGFTLNDQMLLFKKKI